MVELGQYVEFVLACTCKICSRRGVLRAGGACVLLCDNLSVCCTIINTEDCLIEIFNFQGFCLILLLVHLLKRILGFGQNVKTCYTSSIY